MWVPPGKSANPSLWRYDVAQKQFLPPGVSGKPKGTQVEMPEDYTGQEPRGFHMVASPAGTQAPIEHINYTPETGEVHGRGVQAPPDKLNYTLLPSEALMSQQDQQPVGAGQGMGAGAALPSLGSNEGMSSFAGTPPLMGSPVMTGPSPTTNRAAPTWGGGGTPFDTRMGMGAEGDDQDLVTGTSPTGSNATPAPAASGGSQAPAGTQGPAVSQTQSDNVPKGPDGQPLKPGAVVSTVTGKDGKVVVYQIYQDQDPIYDVPRYKWQTGTSADKAITTHVREDGTIDVIDPNKTGTDPAQPDALMVRNVGTPDANLVAKADADRKIQALNLQIAQQDLAIKSAASATAVQEAQLKLQQLQAQAATAQSDADAAAIKAGLAGQAPKEAKPAKIVDNTGEVFLRNEDTGKYEDQGIREAVGTWEKYTNTRTGTYNLVNPQTHEDFELGPIDSYKEYPPIKTTDGSGKWIQWNPATQTYKTVYTENPDSTTEWSGDQLISIDKATKKVTPIWTKKPTQAESDAHDAAIDAHNTALSNLEKTKQDLITGRIGAAEARAKMEVEVQGLLNPKPQQLTAGSIYIPPGLNVNVEDTDPFTGRTSTRSYNGGGQDPRVAKAISDIDALMGNAVGDLNKTGTTPPGATTPPPPSGPAPGTAGGPALQVGTRTPPPSDTSSGSVGTDLAINAAGEGGRAPGIDVSQHPAGTEYKPGWPGSDPRLTGGTQPPTQRTNADGSVTQYDAQGNAIATPNTERADPAEPDTAINGGDEFYDENGRRRGDVGMGNGGMGAGMAAGYTGWAPRPGAINPATGPGFLGAGADGTEQPFDPGAALTQTDTPLSPGGHQPGQDILPTPGHIVNPGEIKGPGPAINTGVGLKLPGATDQGADWIPGLHDLVTQKVNESIKELLGWPKLEHTPPPEGPPIGTQGGFDQPDYDPYDPAKKKALGPTEPSDLKKGPGVRDISHIIGEGGTSPEDWEDMSNEEGIGTAVGKNADPEMQRILDEKRQNMGTTGVGQDEAPGATMPPSGAGPTPAQTPPQGPGGQQPPQWLLTLLQAHPELLRMAGIQAPPAGGASPPGAPPAGWQPQQPPAPTPPAPAPPAGTGQEDDGNPEDRDYPTPVRSPGMLVGAPKPDDPKNLVPKLDGGDVYPWTQGVGPSKRAAQSDPTTSDAGGGTDPNTTQQWTPWSREINIQDDSQPYMPARLPNYVPQPQDPNAPIPVGSGADMPGYSQDDLPMHMNSPRVNSWEGQGGTTEPPAPYGATTPNPGGLPRMPRVKIDPMHAFGSGADMPPMGGAPVPPTGAPPPMPGGAPVAPSPEGAPMTPPLDPSDVAGIGHRFGQDMNVGEPQHSGVDLQAPEGTPTQSPVDGFVTRVEDNPQGLGVTVVIQGMDGSEHRLGHLKSTSAYAGQQVKMGQDLGSPVGDTGMTTGAHLHWGVRDEQGQPADPTQALGPMANMPPVPGTEMMGPPGGVGGAAQQGQPQAPQPQMGGGQAGWKPKKGKRKKGAGAEDFDPKDYQPHQVGWGGSRSGGMTSGMGRPQSQVPDYLNEMYRPMGKVSIDPTSAFGAGAEGRMGAGASPEYSALQQQLQQTWSTMQQGQMSPGGLGARMAQQGSMFGVPAKPAAPPPTMQGAQPPVAPQPPQPQGGGGGGGGGVGSQMSGFLQPGGSQGGGAFAKAGGMPMRQQAPQSAPAGQNFPAQATTQSQQAGWTPQ